MYLHLFAREGLQSGPSRVGDGNETNKNINDILKIFHRTSRSKIELPPCSWRPLYDQKTIIRFHVRPEKGWQKCNEYL